MIVNGDHALECSMPFGKLIFMFFKKLLTKKSYVFHSVKETTYRISYS